MEDELAARLQMAFTLGFPHHPGMLWCWTSHSHAHCGMEIPQVRFGAFPTAYAFRSQFRMGSRMQRIWLACFCAVISACPVLFRRRRGRNCFGRIGIRRIGSVFLGFPIRMDQSAFHFLRFLHGGNLLIRFGYLFDARCVSRRPAGSSPDLACSSYGRWECSGNYVRRRTSSCCHQISTSKNRVHHSRMAGNICLNPIWVHFVGSDRQTQVHDGCNLRFRSRLQQWSADGVWLNSPTYCRHTLRLPKPRLRRTFLNLILVCSGVGSCF